MNSNKPNGADNGAPIEDIPPPLDAEDNTDFFKSIPRRTAGRSKSAEPEGLAAGFAKAKAEAVEKEAERERQRQRAIPARDDDSLTALRLRQFQISHGFLVAVFLWITYIHCVGIYLFTRGFLLTRTVLESKSTCDTLPIIGAARPAEGDGCWYPKTFDKAVIVIIDALRYDFAIPYNTTDHVPHYHNAFDVLYKTTVNEPQNAFMLPFIADPPTTTLQRLKGLTTGTLPTFVDAGSNFAGTAIDEDNVIAQMKREGKRIAFLGDDTWTALYPGYFDIEHAYESLNVWDLHTVDNGVMEHMFPLLQPENSTKWDVMIGHLLGVDHAGHRYGPDHPATNAKLKQMNTFIQDVIDKVDERTLLVVMGDHGMDPKGDHGGESQLELESTIWMYSKMGIFGRTTASKLPPQNAKERSIPQIDLVPTLALLLGLPIPFNNLGAPIEEAFIGSNGANWKQLAEVSRLTAAQIERYQSEYTGKKDSEINIESKTNQLWHTALRSWRELTPQTAGSKDWQDVYKNFSDFQKETLSVCKSLWAKFDLVSMFVGITTMFASIAVLAIYARGLKEDMSELSGRIFGRVMVGGVLSAGAAWLTSLYTKVELSRLNFALLGSALGSILAFFTAISTVRGQVTNVLPNSVFGIISVIFTATQAAMFAANSWTIWEDRILTLFLCTFGLFALISSQRQKDTTSRALGTYYSILFVLLTRLASFSRLCREEQMPYCESTFYASATSSVSSPYSLAILFFLALVFPSIVKSFYNGTKSYEGPAVMYIGISMRMGLALVALYWTLDSADNGNWIDISPERLKAIKHTIAQIVLAMSLLAGNLGFGWMKMCLNVQVVDPEEAPTPQANNPSTKPAGKTVDKANSGQKPKTVKSMILLGYANLHGSRYFLLVITWYIGLALLQKPLGGGSMAILVFQMLTLLEIIDCNDLSSSAIGPVVLGMLGSSHFFSTGHQATLQSVQWEAAFIPMDKIVYPWSPLLVLGNTYGAQILTAIAVPALALWKQPAKQPGLLSKVAKACATFILYHAVIATATTLWAGWLRRHLMLYRIFSPRFLVGGTVLLVVDVVISLIAVVSTKYNIMAVGELFGIA